MTDNAVGVGLHEAAEAWLKEHKKAWSGYDLCSLIRLLEAQSLAQTICDYVSEFGDSTKCGRKKGHKGLHMMVPIVPVTEKGIVDNDDRAFFERHYWQIAKRLHDKRLWRGPWRIEVNGCVYKFTVTGYAKKGSEVWKEQEAEASTTQAK